MIKESVNTKLLNVCLASIILFLIIKTNNFWIRVVDICFPFFVAFILSYAFYPFIRYLNKYFPKFISLIIFLSSFIFIISIFFINVLPLLLKSFLPFLENFIYFFKELGFKYNIDFDVVFNYINNIYDDFLNSGFLAHGIIEVASFSVNFIMDFFMFLFIFIYFIYNMDSIKAKIKSFLNDKMCIYFKQLDIKLNDYLMGFWCIIFITFFEYLIVYFIIGHPNYLILAFITAFLTLIPYFGGILSALVALILAFSSPTLFIKTLIVWLIFSMIDSYVINPLVYKKKNNLNPIIVIFAISIGGKLGGILGVTLAIPIAIVIMHTFLFIKPKKTRKI